MKKSGAEWADEASLSASAATIAGLTARLAEAKRAERAALERLHEQAERFRVAFGIRDYGAPARIDAPAKKRFGGVALALASDWHVDEPVHPRTVNGLNTYSPKIAEQSAANFFQGVAWAMRHHGRGPEAYEIDDLVLWLGGDFISGYIHPELMENNAMSPVKAVRFAARLITGGIDYLLRETSVRITVPCSHGNHERTTDKTRVSTRAENSFGWLLYHTIADRYRDVERVRFHIAEGAHTYLTIADHVVRFSHGDDVRYQGGVGGITIPIAKAISQWDKGRRADLSCFGHWHQFFDGGSFLVNGSLIGYGPYSLSVKGSPEAPRQAFCVLDPDRGKRFVTPIVVRPMRRSARRERLAA